MDLLSMWLRVCVCVCCIRARWCVRCTHSTLLRMLTSISPSMPHINNINMEFYLSPLYFIYWLNWAPVIMCPCRPLPNNAPPNESLHRLIYSYLYLYEFVFISLVRSHFAWDRSLSIRNQERKNEKKNNSTQLLCAFIDKNSCHKETIEK